MRPQTDFLVQVNEKFCGGSTEWKVIRNVGRPITVYRMPHLADFYCDTTEELREHI